MEPNFAYPAFQLHLEGVGHRFRYDWILRDINLHWQSGQCYGIAGPNGSGKSTLLKIMAGFMTPVKGTVSYELEGRSIPTDQVFQHLSWTGPYMELIEEMTLEELVRFHQRFKPFLPGYEGEEFWGILQLPRKARHREIRVFSSGMKQRLRLALAFAARTPLVLLDEPTSNLDRKGIEWYLAHMEQQHRHRLIVVASNVEEDFTYCGERLRVGSK